MSYLIDQEAWLAFYAERLEVDPANLGERDIRLALALYHGAYLPTAATVELRANELDLRERYAEFGFTPNAPSFATAKVRVTLPSAGTAYSLAAPFIVRQGDLTFIATSPLSIPAGSTSGEADIIAQLQGADGTPDEAAATITTAVGWLRGATVEITNVSPGRDGDTTDVIRSEFRAYAFNPQALVRADDHADWVTTNYSNIGRAYAHPRTEVAFNGGTYSKVTNVAGHLTLALLTSAGGIPSADEVDEVKAGLLLRTIPYGADALHVVPAVPLAINGGVSAVVEPGFDHDEIKASIVEAIDAHLDWRSWPHNRHVYSGDIWGAVSDTTGVRYVTNVALDGSTLNGTPSTRVQELEPWEFPSSSFTVADVTLVDAA